MENKFKPINDRGKPPKGRRWVKAGSKKKQEPGTNPVWKVQKNRRIPIIA